MHLPTRMLASSKPNCSLIDLAFLHGVNSEGG
jgi:hypothetical protein